VDYAVAALDLYLPLNAFSPAILKSHQPCPGLKPPLPDLDARTPTAKKRILQLSRLTVAIDEKSISGSSNSVCFVGLRSAVCCG
jgi:ribonuclease P/MRP protein subunit RPP1